MFEMFLRSELCAAVVQHIDALTFKVYFNGVGFSGVVFALSIFTVYALFKCIKEKR